MDQKPGKHSTHPIVVTGTGFEISPDAVPFLGDHGGEPPPTLPHDCRPLEFLRIRKTLKFMSKQDRLALSAAGKALKQAEPPEAQRTLQCGVFITVGYIPFRLEEARALCGHSTEKGDFSMTRFTTDAYDVINPLRAFSCLPNMPAHHLAANFNLQGEYFITYPGTAELYLALQEAVERLWEGSIRFALVGGTADQTNFLVENHYRKVFQGPPAPLADAAAFMVLETEQGARERNQPPLARLVSLQYDRENSESRPTGPGGTIQWGPAQLPLQLSAALSRMETSPASSSFSHGGRHEGFSYSSQWGLL